MNGQAISIIGVLTTIAVALAGGCLKWWSRTRAKRNLRNNIHQEIEHIKTTLRKWWSEDVLYHCSIEGRPPVLAFLQQHRFIAAPWPHWSTDIWDTLRAELLRSLQPREVRAVQQFYDKLDSLSQYRQLLQQKLPPDLWQQYDNAQNHLMHWQIESNAEFMAKLEAVERDATELWSRCQSVVNELLSCNPVSETAPSHLQAVFSGLHRFHRAIPVEQVLRLNVAVLSVGVFALTVSSGHAWEYPLGAIVLLLGLATASLIAQG
jgi:hypothetical protein